MKAPFIDEARGFAQACAEYSGSVDDSFYRDAFRKAAEVIVTLCDELSTGKAINEPSPKEKGKGKETFPPEPPKEKRERQEKAATTTARAYACEVFCPPPKEAVADYAKSKGIPDLFCDYWRECMETNYSPPWFDAVNQRYIVAWRRNLLTYWNNADHDKAWFRFKAGREAEAAIRAKPRRYSAEEWILCAERCQHFDAKLCKCRSGCAIPPEHRPHALIPEECERFAPRPPHPLTGAPRYELPT